MLDCICYQESCYKILGKPRFPRIWGLNSWPLMGTLNQVNYPHKSSLDLTGLPLLMRTVKSSEWQKQFQICQSVCFCTIETLLYVLLGRKFSSYTETLKVTQNYKLCFRYSTQKLISKFLSLIQKESSKIVPKSSCPEFSQKFQKIELVL